jgi:hypothetical protein
MPALEAYSVWQPLHSPGSAWAILILIDIDRLLKSAGLSRLDLSYARQHLFRKELEGAQRALWLFRTGTLKGQVDHPSAHFLVALLDLLHDRIRTADKIRWQSAIPQGRPRHPCNVARIELGEGVTYSRPHGERHLSLLLPPL